MIRYRFRAADESPVAKLPHTIVVEEDGTEWFEVMEDDLHTGSGPGYELKRLLARFPFYIKVTPSCPCNRRARQMDELGCDWCEQNLSTIVGWLQEEHSRQGVAIPFIYPAVEQLVLLAIRRARKKGNK